MQDKGDHCRVAGWRVVIVSQVAPAVVAIDAGLRALGHRTVAVVASRSGAEREPEFFVRLHREAPADVDLLHPADRTRIAPLIAPYGPDLLICNGFPWLIPDDALSVPRLGAINIHPSLLPRWRGPTPVSWAIRTGEREIGTTVHRMDASFDTGPVLAQGAVTLPEDAWSWEELGPQLSKLGAQLLPRALERVEKGDPGDLQPPGDYPYAHLFEDAYVEVDWSRPADEVLRQLRAWQFTGPTRSGRQGPLAEIQGETVRILRACRETANEGVHVECADAPVWVTSYVPVDGTG